MAQYTILANRAATVHEIDPGTNFPGAKELDPRYTVNLSNTGQYIYKDNAFIGFPYPAEIAKKRVSALFFRHHVESIEVWTTAVGTFSYFGAAFTPGCIEGEWVEAEVSYENQPRFSTLAGRVAGGYGVQQTELPTNSIEKLFKYGLAIATSGSYRLAPNKTTASGYHLVKITGYDSFNPQETAPALVVTAEDIVPTIEQPSPAAGYVDERRTTRFSWIFTGEGPSLVPVAQKSGRFQWRAKGSETYAELPVGTNQYVDVPAGSFPSQAAVEWRLQVVSDDNIASNWTHWFEVTTIDSAAAAVAIRPSGQYLDRSLPIDFVWRHASPSGTAQTRAELEVRYGNGEWQPLAALDGAEQTYTLPGSALASGNMAWRVRTYNSQGEAGEWSRPLENIVIAPPPAPIINAIDPARSRPLVSWQGPEQSTYRVQVLRGEMIHDTGTRLGPEREYQLPDYLDNGPYTVRVCVGNEYGYWSEWAEYILEIDAYKPPAPSAMASPVRYGVHVMIADRSTEIERVLLYRRQAGETVLIAVLDAGQDNHIDYLAAGEADYIVRGIDADDNFADCPPLRAAPDIPHFALALASRPGDIFELRYRLGSPLQRARSMDAMGSTAQFEGRNYPVMEYGAGRQQSFTVNATLKRHEELLRLEAMVVAKETFVLRSPRGERAFCAIGSINCPDDAGRYFDVEIPCTVIDASEVEGFA